MTDDQEASWHPVDDYLARAHDHDDTQKDHRERVLNAVEALSNYLLDNRNTPPPLTITDQLSDGLLVYVFAHQDHNDLKARIPEHLLRFAEKARKHVERGDEFSLDHALGISTPTFRGAKPKKLGDHKHQRLFLMAFHDYEVIGAFNTQIEALQNAARMNGLRGYEEKALDGEYRKWRDISDDWLTWLFDVV